MEENNNVFNAIPIDFINQYLENLKSKYPNESDKMIELRRSIICDLYNAYVFTSIMGDNWRIAHA